MEHFWTNRRLARTMLGGGARPAMNGQLRDMIEEELADLPHAAGMPTALLATHLAHGHLALIEEWLTGRHGCPASRLADMLHGIARATLRRPAFTSLPRP